MKVVKLFLIIWLLVGSVASNAINLSLLKSTDIVKTTMVAMNGSQYLNQCSNGKWASNYICGAAMEQAVGETAMGIDRDYGQARRICWANYHNLGAYSDAWLFNLVDKWAPSYRSLSLGSILYTALIVTFPMPSAC